jgi:DNA-binding MarR family transcriptional regulator
MSTDEDRPFRLDEHVGYLLRRAYARAEETASTVIPPPFHARDLAVLSLLQALGPRSQQELSELCRVNRTIMVKLIDGLEQRSLVRRDRNPADRRSYALAPTTQGRQELRRLSTHIADGDQLLTANLTAQERDRLRHQLTRLLASNKALEAGPAAQLCGYLITHAHHQTRDQAREPLAQLGLDSRKLGAIAAINEHQPCSQQHLAERLAVSAPVVAELTEQLVNDGLVQRVRDPSDRRRYDLTLTTAGHERLGSGAHVIAKIDADIARRLTPSGMVELRRLLTKLLDQPHPRG